MNIVQEYRQSLKLTDAEEPLDLYFYRIVSFLFVKLIYPLPITPNQLSVAAMVMGIISGVYFAGGTPVDYTWAAIFYAIYYLFDLSDGQVARLKKNGTRLGRIIDGIADYVTHGAIYIGLGIGLAKTSGEPLESWLLVLITLFSLLFQVVLFDYYRNRYLQYVYSGVSLYGEDLQAFKDEYYNLKQRGGSSVSLFIYYVYLKYLRLQQFFTKDNVEIPPSFDKDDFLRKNKTIIRLWSFMGSSLHITLLIVLALVNRIQLYFYLLLFVINAYALLMLFVQYIIDRQTKPAGETV